QHGHCKKDRDGRRQKIAAAIAAGQADKDHVTPHRRLMSVTAILADWGPPSPSCGLHNNRTEFARTPRPTRSRVTVRGGRSPGSRVVVFGPPFPRVSVTLSGKIGRRLAAYSCGGSRGIGRSKARAPRSLLIPIGNHRENLRFAIKSSQGIFRAR